MDTLALILSIIGSLNWGLVGLFRFDLVAWLFGGQTAVLSRIVYALVGLAGLWCITLLFRRHALTATEDISQNRLQAVTLAGGFILLIGCG